MDFRLSPPMEAMAAESEAREQARRHEFVGLDRKFPPFRCQILMVNGVTEKSPDLNPSLWT